ncbi:MAG: hypothetical protein HY913_12060 [Desulfomonile tiedjei]|nr:hypothetical protein [Desulfomonile tiedjei]
MKAVNKIFLIALLILMIPGLAFLSQRQAPEAISVSLATSPCGLNHEGTKVVLKAAVNGTGLSHGVVRLEFKPMKAVRLVFDSDYKSSIYGYTDAHGVFITNWTPIVPGEYMVTALVKKPGLTDGASVCFATVSD